MDRNLEIQQGATLLEALVAILVFSIGIVGLLGLQAASAANASHAKFRADAGYLADQMIGHIWADRANIALYNHYPGAGANACNPTGAASTNANVLAWLQDVATALPNATAARQQIAVAAGNVVTVTVCWQAPGEAGPHNFSETAQING